MLGSVKPGAFVPRGNIVLSVRTIRILDETKKDLLDERPPDMVGHHEFLHFIRYEKRVAQTFIKMEIDDKRLGLWFIDMIGSRPGCPWRGNHHQHEGSLGDTFTCFVSNTSLTHLLVTYIFPVEPCVRRA